jgi:hypothetical protein
VKAAVPQFYPKKIGLDYKVAGNMRELHPQKQSRIIIEETWK